LAAKKGCFVIDPLSEAASGGTESPWMCSVLAAVWKSVPISDPASLRSQVIAAFPHTLSGGVLKQTDEQNLPALLALKQALEQGSLSAEQWGDWGLVAVPRMPCRRRVANAIAKFREQGAWSVSPHLIPNTSLHSASGLFSQALRLHGPNIGAGGMPGTESDGIWAAMAMLEGERLPGVWLIFTGLATESLTAPDVQSQVAVLGLQSELNPFLPTLSIAASARSDAEPPLTLEALGESIRRKGLGRWNIGGAICTVSHRQVAQGAAA
jgi:hypothetical protein